jgi:uncharacterized protein YqeY
MTLKQRLMDDVKVAMKAGDKTRVDCLRMVRSKILEQEVDLRADKGRDYELDDEEATRVLASYAKQRRDSIDSYRQGGREDLAVREEAELKIIEEYLPSQLSEDALREIVSQAVAESGASSPKEMGMVMKIVMPRVRGAADGKLVNRIVQEILAKPEP